MADRRRSEEAVVSASAATIEGLLRARLGEVSRSIQQILAAEISELRGDSQLVELLGASVEGNIDTVFHALRYDIPIERVEPPTAALEYARRLAQHGVPSNALVRAYRLGQQALLDVILDEIRAADLEPRLSLDVYERMTTVTFRYIDWISQHAVGVYDIERDRWSENRNSVRAVRVRELLDDGEVDLDAVTAAIRYPLRRIHLALILWYPADVNVGNELVRLERFLRELTESLPTQGSALFVAADRVSGWGWIPLGVDAAPTVEELVRRFIAERHDAPCVALGTPLPDVEGFRRSHRQAENARDVAIAAGPRALRVTASSDPGLSAAALLGGDLSEARAWVRDILGLLATNSDNDARLRDTLRVFLQHGASYKAAADELNLHFNSVKYRVQRAVDRRGRSIGEDRLDIELALVICHWFGPAVLWPVDDGHATTDGIRRANRSPVGPGPGPSM
ncbi:helix-turn-helix domain-containing protein [Nocardia sp. NBC_00565]|uniref:PucR family transcriptional regulator n=1 Tax=Nocardia sp. NBC_00565 TaxID=2975993 RepID=UPI002E8082C8|nr:helix-turn-helix domain-containing protein [Nocardia sp. NBC_00565]WUC07372.1 helix-turn-helix domain-containing protein [Nocardia sp. NBC_00565]